MTGIDFHVNVADRLVYGCRLLRKVYLSGSQVVVTGSPGLLAELDDWLWRFSALEFVPHCYASAALTTLAVTPVVLADTLSDCGHREVLVNLGTEIPAGFEGFERFIEVVAAVPAEAEAGRQRWKHYKARGYQLVKHDLAAMAATAGSGSAS